MFKLSATAKFQGVQVEPHPITCPTIETGLGRLREWVESGYGVGVATETVPFKVAITLEKIEE